MASFNIFLVFSIIFFNSSLVNSFGFLNGFILDKNSISSAYIFPIPVIILWSSNTSLIGFFNFNLVDTLFGSVAWLTRTIYAIVGIAGVYSIAFYGREKQRDY